MNFVIQLGRKKWSASLSIAFCLFFPLLFSSCGPDRALLETQARNAISKDIISVSNACIDQMTLGIGGMLMDLTMSKSEKDSLVIRPLMPYIDEALKTKSVEELQQLSSAKKERLKFLAGVINSNRENITKGAGEKLQLLKDLVDLIIKYIDKIAAELPTQKNN